MLLVSLICMKHVMMFQRTYPSLFLQQEHTSICHSSSRNFFPLSIDFHESSFCTKEKGLLPTAILHRKYEFATREQQEADKISERKINKVIEKHLLARKQLENDETKEIAVLLRLRFLVSLSTWYHRSQIFLVMKYRMLSSVNIDAT